MIIEGLLTTQDAEGRPHLAPMGPVVDAELGQWILRPFQSSTTFRLLRRDPKCVFHVTDDILTLVRCVLNLELDNHFERIEGGWVLSSACHWYQLQVHGWDVSQDRSEAMAHVIARGRIRPFWGWNRAKHAVLEATILTTRLHLLERSWVEAEFSRLAPAVEKTAGACEREAWNLLVNHLRQHSW